MQYGYFDDKAHEYVITRPDTPRSWTNYLGNTQYGVIMTNNAGGYSFYKSAAQGRFTRLVFNNIPRDQPGKYLYLRDKESGEYWSASWQPVGKPLDKYTTTCRHGTAYTIIESEYSKIQTETTYFVPRDKDFEFWLVKITNKDDRTRTLNCFTYVEFASHWHVRNDLLNRQFAGHIINMQVNHDIIDCGVNIYAKMESKEENLSINLGRHSFIGLIGTEVEGYDTDREVFLGKYRDYSNPIVVEQGECTGSLAVGGNGCGTLQTTDIKLKPGESKEFCVVMGIGKAEEEGQAAIQEFNSLKTIKQAFEELKQYWHDRISNLTVETPDPEFNSMMNTWNPYNCHITYSWSRAASLVYAGARDGLGYRDTVQDILGVLHNIPQEAKQRLELMITGQVSNGGAMPLVKPFDHKPGEEERPKKEEYRSDDCMWLFITVPAYIKETGDLAFYEKVLPYADAGEDTVLGHLKRAMEFSLNHMGQHGLPCGLRADWNDCLNLGYEGETTFVGLQLRYALKTYIDICDMLNKPEEVSWAQTHLKKLDENLTQHAWDGKWYLRAYRDDGFKFGSQESPEGKIWLNPQSWSVLSGHADQEKAQLAMDAVKERLASEAGIAVSEPYRDTDFTVISAVLYNPGMKENASIFTHCQGWAIMAETKLGRGNRAYEYYRAYMPAAYNTRAEVREIEPYVYNQFNHSKYSPRFEAGRVPWLSGTAAWSYYSTSHYILGIRPDYQGLHIDPCIPATWKGFTATRVFRGKTIKITVKNESGAQKGVRKMFLNDEEIKDTLIPFDKLKADNTVTVLM